MGKFILSLLLIHLLIPYEVLSQNIDKSERRFSFGLVSSADYAYRNISYNYGDKEDLGLVIEIRNEAERPLFGYTVGLTVGMKIFKDIGLEIEGRYALRGYQNRKADLATFTNPDIDGWAQIEYHHSYIDIPVLFRYSHDIGKVRAHARVGGSANIFIEETIVQRVKRDGDLEVKRISSDDDYVTITYSLEAGYYAQVFTWQLLTMEVGPRLRLGLSDILDTPITGRLWTVGLDVGFRWR
jgi:hypothetical protein